MVQRTGSWIDGEHILQNAGTGCSRQCRLTGEARDKSSSPGCETSQNRLLPAARSKNVAVGQQRNRSLLILEQAFVGKEQECLVLFDGETNGPAKLLAA